MLSCSYFKGIEMPELPEVETIKEALIKAVDHSVIRSVSVFNRNFRIPIPDDFEKLLTGQTISRIYRRAKYVIINLTNGISIVWHFGMSGRVRIISQKKVSLEKHDHVMICTDNCTLVFNDARRFGLITCMSSQDLEHSSIFAHVGIDPFDPQLDGEYLFSKIKYKHIPIKVALLDQSIICGIGNIYASEALYLARISPLRLCCAVSFEECSTLVVAVRDILKKAIRAGGSTLRDYRQPDGSMGYFQMQHAVYGKEGLRCPDCTCDCSLSGGIKKIVQAGRSTFYCDYLQK